MRKMQQLADKAAIGLSMLCVMHCLVFPLLIIVVPSLFGMLATNDEQFHQWLVYSVVPISLFALYLGYAQHKNRSAFVFACYGLTLLIFTAFFAHDLLGETAEVVLTVIGSAIITLSHIKNYKLRTMNRCTAGKVIKTESI